MRVLLERCARVSAAAVERTVDRFADGDIERANRAFAPSGEEFMVEARRIQGCLDAVEQAKTLRIARTPLFNAETRAEAEKLGFLPGEISRLQGEFCFLANEREDFYPSLNHRQAWSAFLAARAGKSQPVNQNAESANRPRQTVSPEKQRERFAAMAAEMAAAHG